MHQHDSFFTLVLLTFFPAVTAVSNSTWNITLTSKLTYFHEASGYIFAEVVLLDRQIVVQGLDEASPNQYDGRQSCTHFSTTIRFANCRHAANLLEYIVAVLTCSFMTRSLATTSS